MTFIPLTKDQWVFCQILYKKYLLFKIAHLILMTFTIVIIVVGMVHMINRLGSGNDGLLIIRMLSSLVRILAMITGIIYLVSGYKKSSAKYYKIFFCLMMLALVFRLLVFITNKESTVMMLGAIVTISLACILMLGKDLGRNVSFILLAILLVIEILLLLPVGITGVSLGQLGGELSMFMLYGTAGFMITAKYIDKSLRGSN